MRSEGDLNFGQEFQGLYLYRQDQIRESKEIRIRWNSMYFL